MRDLEVEGVWPDRGVGERGRNGAVVHEAELLHHQELSVPSGLQERNSEAPDLLDLDAAEPVDDVRLEREVEVKEGDQKSTGCEVQVPFTD